MTAAAREMFAGETIAALKIIDRGDLAPSEMVGSWAGELGQTQFLPTHYFNYAVDYDGDGRRDLLRSPADVIGSTANYIANGLKWRRGEPWLQEVRVPPNRPSFPWDQADLTIQLPRSKWAQLGVTYPDGKPLPNDDLPASLLLPMGRTGPAFLAYANFAAYTEWNNSLIYSTTAGYLATRIAGAAPMLRPTAPVAQLPFNELRELQQLLVRAGFNVGKVDGVMGQQSRSAVKAMQIKYGLPADSWPTAELLARMRGAPARRRRRQPGITCRGVTYLDHLRVPSQRSPSTERTSHVLLRRHRSRVPADPRQPSGHPRQGRGPLQGEEHPARSAAGARLYPDMLPLSQADPARLRFRRQGLRAADPCEVPTDAGHRKDL